jgi:hypothetical protein
MKLVRCLKTCTWHHLWAVAYGRDLAVPRNPTKTQLRDLVLDDLSDPEALAHEIEDLPPEALAILQLLALNHEWLSRRDLTRRFGELRPFKPWDGEPPGEAPPWRDPISPLERLWYRGLIYAQKGVSGRLGLHTEGLRLPENFVPLVPPAPSPAHPRQPQGDGAPAPALLYNLVLFHAHLSGHAFRPREGRWLTPTQFRPLLDRLWPPECPVIAADRRCRGEKSTRLLRALHFVAEAAGFVAAPASPDPEALLPTLQWHDWLARSLLEQFLDLEPILTGADPDLAAHWRAFELPGWQMGDNFEPEAPLVPLRRLHRTLRDCPADGAWLDLEAFLAALPWRHVDVLPGQTGASNLPPASGGDRGGGSDDPHRQLMTGLLAWLGLVQLDRWETPTAFRLTPLGATLLRVPGAERWQPADHPLRLGDEASGALPLAIDPDCAPALLHHLATHPRLEWTGPGAAQLTRASLAGASRREVSELVHLLNRGLDGSVPGKAVGHLWDWAGQGTSLAIRRVTLLEADEADLLAHLAGQRGIRRHFRRSHGRHAVEVDSNTLESLLRKLHHQGLAPDVGVELRPRERPIASRRWGPEDAGHLLLAAKVYNRLPGRSPLGSTRHRFRPTHGVPQTTLDRLAEGLPPRVLETVEQMADDALRRMYEAIDGWRAPPLFEDERLAGQALDEVLALVRDALAQDALLDLEYYTAGRGELTKRTVEPLRLEDRDGAAYLVAYCRLRQDQRVFRVDRIRSAQISS